MPTIHDVFTVDHRRCDELFADAEAAVQRGQWPAATLRYRQFREALLHHIEVEESTLFPALEEHIGGTFEPAQVMRAEHEELRGLLEELGSAIEERDADGFLAAAETLHILIQQHNVKEEQMLYRMADEMLGDDVPDLLERLEGLGA